MISGWIYIFTRKFVREREFLKSHSGICINNAPCISRRNTGKFPKSLEVHLDNGPEETRLDRCQWNTWNKMETLLLYSGVAYIQNPLNEAMEFTADFMRYLYHIKDGVPVIYTQWYSVSLGLYTRFILSDTAVQLKRTYCHATRRYVASLCILYSAYQSTTSRVLHIQR